MIDVGMQAPGFTLMTDTGEERSLASLKGHRVVLFFYPRADTPG
jgi:peroxiredoxin Q/BCP